MNKLRFQSAQHHPQHGWYVCTLGAKTQYLHSDMSLHDSTHNTHNVYSGYYKSEREANDALANYIRNHIGDS